ncbi:MAG TPA: glycosyltransferase [Gemmatimonadaceae bacterium]|nr:glycosyltransferase [Gemmatimonadaceae bacterium]
MSAAVSPSRARAPRRGRTPTLSIVVASRDDRALLDACLAHLLPASSHGLEVIVVRAGTASEVAALARANGWARIIQAPHDATLRQLRSIGMAEATGDIVALADERGGCDMEWMEKLLRHAGVEVPLESPAAAAARAADWSAYFAERGLFSEWRRQASA